DHDGVRGRGRLLHLLRRRDAEAERHRDAGERAKPGDQRPRVVRERLALAGDARAADRVHEAAARFGHLPQPLVGAGRRGQEDGVDLRGACRGDPRLAFLGRQVRDEHAVHSGLRGLPRDALEAALQQGVQVAEEHEGQLARLPDLADELEHAGERDPPRQRALARPLDHRAVGQGIRERHAQLQHVHSRLLELERRAHRAFERRVAGRQEGDERRPAFGLALREPRGDPSHAHLLFGSRWVLDSLTTASTSISTIMSGLTSALTSTIVAAGRMSRNTCPCARPTASQREMSVTYIRVRTTSRKLAPASWSAFSMLRKHWTACAYGSPLPTIAPSSPVAVVPETLTYPPIRTAREYPTIGS